MKIRQKIAGIALALATAVGGVVVGSSTPAAADHQFVFGHWHVGVYPAVQFQHSPRANVEDAAYMWESVSGKGYTRLDQGGVCLQFTAGIIQVCNINRDQNAGHDGQGGTLRDGAGHAYAGVAWVTNGLSPARHQIVHRHEFGHALGLGHTSGFDLMRSDGPTPYVYQHSADAIRLMARS